MGTYSLRNCILAANVGRLAIRHPAHLRAPREAEAAEGGTHEFQPGGAAEGYVFSNSKLERIFSNF